MTTKHSQVHLLLGWVQTWMSKDVRLVSSSYLWWLFLKTAVWDAESQQWLSSCLWIFSGCPGSDFSYWQGSEAPVLRAGGGAFPVSFTSRFRVWYIVLLAQASKWQDREGQAEQPWGDRFPLHGCDEGWGSSQTSWTWERRAVHGPGLLPVCTGGQVGSWPLQSSRPGQKSGGLTQCGSCFLPTMVSALTPVLSSQHLNEMNLVLWIFYFNFV